MDPVSIVQSALTLAISIKLWLDAQNEKEHVIKSISATTDRLCGILTPFKDESTIRKLDNNVIAAFNAINDVLLRTRGHLIAWRGKKLKLNSISNMITFFVPSQVTKALKQDEHDLNTQLLGMLFVLAVNNLLRETNEKDKKSWTSEPEEKRLEAPPTYQESVNWTARGRSVSPQPTRDTDTERYFDNTFTNTQVRQFWRDYIGEKVFPSYCLCS
jgi:hypothetical protein